MDIIKLKDSSKIIGTSFHGDYIVISPNKLKDVFGEPSFAGSSDDKTQAEWHLEYDNIPFAFYDWKEYEDFAYNKEIQYHIGTHTAEESHIIHDMLIEYFKSII